MPKNKYLIFTHYLVFAGIILHLIAASTLGLGIDESYTASISRIVQLSYFDHPPLHYWIIKLSLIVFGSQSPVALRFPFIIFFAGTCYLLFLSASNLFNAKAGFYSVLALNITAIASYMSFALLPDGPLMFFMMTSLFLLTKLLFVLECKNSLILWFLFGLFAGLAMLSKYQGVFIFFGLFIFALSSRKWRYLFRSAYFYLSGLIAILTFSPVMLWNIQNDWVSFAFQGARGLSDSVKFTPLDFLGNIAGQMGYLLPWVWLPMIFILFYAFKSGPDNSSNENFEQNKTWFLCCMAIGPIIIFTLPALWGGEGLPHWQFPGYLMLFPLLGRWIGIESEKRNKLVRRCLIFAAAIVLGVWTLIITQVNFDWISYLNPKIFEKNNPSWELLDWNDLPTEIDSGNILKLNNISFIAADNWILAGKIDYAMKGKLPVLPLSVNKHNYSLMCDQRRFIGKNALIILPSDESDQISNYSNYFEKITKLEPLFIFHNLVNQMKLDIFVGQKYKAQN